MKFALNQTAKFSKNKISATAIILLLVLSMTATLIAEPTATAHTPPWQITTWAYVSSSPEVLGVGQTALIVMWCNLIPPTASGQYGDRYTFNLNIVKPDGTNDTLGPYTSDPVGGTYINYVPTEVGNYTLQSFMLQHTLTGQPVNPNVALTANQGYAYWGDVLLASTSPPVTMVVQNQQIPTYKETPLPEAYWTRPIYGTNHNWYQIAGQWLGGGDTIMTARANIYSTGPITSHINWAVPMISGGLVGGGSSYTNNAANTYSGQSYETISGPSIIEAGLVYYTVSTPPREGWYALSLYTGEVQYFQNTTGFSPNSNGGGGTIGSGSLPNGAPSFGQVLEQDNPDQHGAFNYLWVTATATGNWDMLDASTGNYICSIGNVTQSTRTLAGTSVTTGAVGTSKTDNIGSICYYNIVNLGTAAAPKTYLQIWNTTQAIWYQTLIPGTVYYQAANQYWSWRPDLNFTFNGNYGFSLNASIPAVQGSVRQIINGNMIIGGTTGNITSNPGQNYAGNLWALNLDPTKGALGSLLWNITFTPPQGLGDSAIQSLQFTNKDAQWGGIDANSGIFWFVNPMLRVYYVYDIATGNLLWTSDPLPQWNFYGMSTSCLNGVLYSYGYDGILHAFEAKTGNVLWNWYAPDVGLGETPYPHTPLSWGCACNATGQTLIYMYSNEHSVNAPIRRDAQIWCINASDGKMLWSLNGWPYTAPIIADGRLVYANAQDALIYCFGPGLSKTTVSAPQTTLPMGSPITITGTVTDDTPSGKDQGTPAISDASMDAWMAYMYQQQPYPANATGVPVSLDAYDPNGNLIHIGDVTSDSSGNYGYEWTTPDIAGHYTIIATFHGSGAYGSSFATAYTNVGEAAATPAPTATPLSEATITSAIMMDTALAAVAIIIAIAIVGILILRKRP